MVLINDKKYACATCIKGHRVSGCTHTDRPLFEVKKKGRPATQCQFCREKRKGGANSGSVHTKCACGDLKNQQPQSIMLSQAGGGAVTVPNPSASSSSSSQSITTIQAVVSQLPPPQVETKKGQPGSTPTFPNGLRDVHEMAAAAQALGGLSDTGNQAAERKLQNLLNPCNCATTGVCKCCGPKQARDYPPKPRKHSAHDTATHSQVTDSLIEMFKSKATTATTSPSEGGSGSSTPQQPTNSSPFASLRTVNLAMTSANNNNLASPDNRHHPAHTSPYVHKTRLYSPYSTNGHSTPRHGVKPRSESVSSTGSLGPGWASSSTSTTSPRPPPKRIRPLTDMNKFLGAAFKEDGTVASEIPRSALGLPGIHTFDAKAIEGGVKVEEMEMDVDAPVSFPTAEDVVIGACTCGDGCECPGCLTHANPQSSTSSPKEHGHESCGDACKSCFDCSENVSIPSGVTSIEHLIQVAASKVPQNPPRPSQLNPLDTRVLPPAANVSEDAARAFGLVNLLPLQCCNGRCQCPPGQCSCESECCGCCVRCLCDHDGDAVMQEEAHQERPSGGCCSSNSPVAPGVQTQMLSAASCSPSTISPTSPTRGPRQPSPGVASSCCSTTTPPNGPASHSAPASGVRRAASVSRAKEAQNGGGHTTPRRVSVSNGSGVARSASISSKSASKSLALHPGQPRAILPKPTANNRLALPRSNSGSSRQPSPVHRGSVSGSSQPSQSGSPVLGPATLPTAPETLALPDSGVSDTVSNPGDAMSVHSDSLQVPGATADTSSGAAETSGASGDTASMAVGVDDIANALAASDVDFMAYLNSLLTGPSEGDSMAPPAAASSSESAAPVDPLTSSSYSFATSLAVSSAASDLSLLDLTPTATQSHNPRSSTDVESSMVDIQQLIANTLEQQGMMPRPDASADYAYLLSQQVYSYGGNSNGPLAVPANPLGAHLSASSQTNAPPESYQNQNLYFGTFGPPMPQLPQQQPGPQPQAMDMRPVSRGSSAEEPVPQLPPPPAQAPAPAAQPNPDIIDLSKPLNPSDVDRILQALLTQQARQAAATGESAAAAQAQAQVQAQSQAPPSSSNDPASEHGDPFDDFMFDPNVVDMHGAHPQQQLQPTNREWLLKSGWTPNLLGRGPPA